MRVGLMSNRVLLKSPLSSRAVKRSEQSTMLAVVFLECSHEQRTAQVAAMEVVTAHRRRRTMTTTTLLIIVLIVLFLGGGFYGRGRWF